MTTNFRLTPVFFTALGAAAGFYFLSFFGFTALIIFLSLALAALSFFYSFVTFTDYAGEACPVFKTDRRIKLLSNFITVFVTGLTIGVSAANIGNQPPRFALLPERITAIEGVLTEDPRITANGNTIAVAALKKCAAKELNGFLRATAKGEITVFFPKDNAVKLREFGRGTAVFSEGVLRLPEDNKGAWTFSASSVHVVKPAPAIQRMRTGIRLNLVNRFSGKEWGGLSLALLLGIKDNLDSELSMAYRSAGCSYILALSGMHLAVLTAIIAFLLRKPLGLKAASFTGAVIICLYCFIVGPMPSLNRALLMYLLGTACILGFLPLQPLSVLSLSFLIQLIITPAAGNSISFILSYLALFGIFIIGQPLYELFSGKAPDILIQPLSASCSAFITTAGITGSVFGYLAPVGIIAGLVLVPLATLYMILSILWLILDFLSVSGFFGIPVSFLYKLMTDLISIAARTPVISAANPSVLVILSLIISIYIVLFENRQRKSRLMIKSF